MHPRHVALVRRPSATLADGLVTHIESSEIDVARALAQWQDYREALEANGWPTIEVPALDSAPDAVFIEDALVLFGELAVVTSPGAPSRRPETTALPAVVGELGLELAHLAEGTLDGGDVLKVGRTVYVGTGGRTDAEGVTSLVALLQPRGYDVVAVPMEWALHLKSAVTALPDGTVIGFEPVAPDTSIFPSFLAVPEEPGAHVVVLDDDVVLMSSRAPETAALLADRGLRVVTVDIEEFERLEGCVTCLSVRVR